MPKKLIVAVLAVFALTASHAPSSAGGYEHSHRYPDYQRGHDWYNHDVFRPYREYTWAYHHHHRHHHAHYKNCRHHDHDEH